MLEPARNYFSVDQHTDRRVVASPLQRRRLKLGRTDTSVHANEIYSRPPTRLMHSGFSRASARSTALTNGVYADTDTMDTEYDMDLFNSEGDDDERLASI